MTSPPDDPPDTMLIALADNALPEPDAARLRAAIAHDAELARRYETYVAQRSLLGRLNRDVLDEAVPARLLATVRGLDAATRLAAPPPAPPPAPGPAPEPEPEPQAQPQPMPAQVLPFRPRREIPRGGAWRPLAIAASVALAIGGVAGFGLGRMGGGDGGATAGLDPVGRGAAALAEALERAPSGSARPWAGGQVAILHTHPVAGVPCRDFALQDGGRAILGLACREAGAWRTRLALSRPVAAGGFVPAGSEEPLVRELLDRLGAEAPLDAAAERAAIARAWR